MKICIILNGPLRKADISHAQIDKFDKIIAVDGGSNKCYDYGITPDFIIGDFDSVRKQVLDYFSTQNTQIISAPSQYTLDFQEAIWLADAIFSGAEIQTGLASLRNSFLNNSTNKLPAHKELLQLTVFGALSDSQIDHTLGNILLGINLPAHIVLKFFNPGSDIFVTKKPLHLEGKLNDIVSVIPLQKTIALSYTNLLYPVHMLDVDIGWLGSRNRMTAKQATISFESGTLLIVRH